MQISNEVSWVWERWGLLCERRWNPFWCSNYERAIGVLGAAYVVRGLIRWSSVGNDGS